MFAIQFNMPATHFTHTFKKPKHSNTHTQTTIHTKVGSSCAN